MKGPRGSCECEEGDENRGGMGQQLGHAGLLEGRWVQDPSDSSRREQNVCEAQKQTGEEC